MTLLRRRMTEDMQLRQFSPRTQETYLYTVTRFALHFGRSPAQLGPAHIRAYQLHLLSRHASRSTLIVTVAALRFFYTVTLKRPWTVERLSYPRPHHRLPVVLSRTEVSRFLAAATSLRHRTILTTIYATGLRVSEVVVLKVSDIDSQRMLIRVHQGKGAADRYVMLSPRLLSLLRTYWKAHHPTEWLFPDRVLGKPLTTRQVKRICHEVRERAKLTKTVSPHTLRTVSTYYYSFPRMLYFSGSSACPATG